MSFSPIPRLANLLKVQMFYFILCFEICSFLKEDQGLQSHLRTGQIIMYFNFLFIVKWAR
jgi:hypothetical protein